MHTKRRKDDFSITPLSMKELVGVLAKHYDLDPSQFDLAVEFQIGVGPVGPDKDEPLPGIIVGLKTVSLRPKGMQDPVIEAPKTEGESSLATEESVTPRGKSIARSRKQGQS